MISIYFTRMTNAFIYEIYKFCIKNVIVSSSILGILALLISYFFFQKNWNSILLDSAKKGDIIMVKEALKRGADKEAKDANGATAVILASFHGHFEVVYELVANQKAKAHAEDYGRGNALMAASMTGHLEIVKFLVKRGARVKAKRHDSTTALIFAAQMGHFEAVRFLVESGSDIRWKNARGLSALSAAVEKKRFAEDSSTRSKKNLGFEGVPGSVNSSPHASPRHKREADDYAKIVAYLLSQGANLESKDLRGWTSLTKVAYSGYMDILSVLLEQKKIVIDSKANNGFTPLMAASQKGNEDIFDILVSRGASVDAKTDDGLNPLILASGGGHCNLVKKIIQYSPSAAELDVNGKGGESQGTALMAAAFKGNMPIVKMLLANGAVEGLEVENKDGWTALMAAVDNERDDVSKHLLSLNANPSHVSTTGWTALMSAVSKGNTDLVELLVLAGASLSCRQEDGWSALMIASYEGFTDIVEILLERGADLSVRSRDGNTALTLASSRGYSDIIDLILQAVDRRETDVRDAVEKKSTVDELDGWNGGGGLEGEGSSIDDLNLLSESERKRIDAFSSSSSGDATIRRDLARSYTVDDADNDEEGGGISNIVSSSLKSSPSSSSSPLPSPSAHLSRSSSASQKSSAKSNASRPALSRESSARNAGAGSIGPTREQLLSMRTREGKTAIGLAASRGNAKAVNRLLAAGARVPYNDLGWTASRVFWLKIRSSLGVGERVAER